MIPAGHKISGNLKSLYTGYGMTENILGFKSPKFLEKDLSQQVLEWQIMK